MLSPGAYAGGPQGFAAHMSPTKCAPAPSPAAGDARKSSCDSQEGLVCRGYTDYNDGQ